MRSPELRQPAATDATLAERLADDYHAREPFWSEASAIGSDAFVRPLAGVRQSGQLQLLPSLSVGEQEPLYMLTLSSRAHGALWARKQDD